MVTERIGTHTLCWVSKSPMAAWVFVVFDTTEVERSVLRACQPTCQAMVPEHTQFHMSKQRTNLPVHWHACSGRCAALGRSASRRRRYSAT